MASAANPLLLVTAASLRRLAFGAATFSATSPIPVFATPPLRDLEPEPSTAVPVAYAAAGHRARAQGAQGGESRGSSGGRARRGPAGEGVSTALQSAHSARLTPTNSKLTLPHLPVELDISYASLFDCAPSPRSTRPSTSRLSTSFRTSPTPRISSSSSQRPSLPAGSLSSLRLSALPQPRTLSTLRPSPPLRSTLHPQERPVLDGGDPPAYSISGEAGGVLGGARGLGTEPPPPEEIKEETEEPRGEKSAPRMDELNSLLRHPTLYDPVLVPRFPIVLCHGLYGFDVRGPAFFRLHYWGDLLKILRGKIGAEVFVTAVPGTGAVKQRANVLHHLLEETKELQGRDLNFLAHSMGGLDARYLISNIRPTTYHPRSLTTLSTPHRGSEFMAWCRANIGIGTDFDASSGAAARALHEDASSPPLPFSLRAPILSRAQQAAKDAAAAENVKAGLPFNLSTSLSGYLLDLLDSPAYANLTPNFLRDVFNPSTPDRPDVRYYSIAARTDKIGIWHPLWLPKMVLDGAEAARIAQGAVPDPQWRGNDGLVNVESAKWGDFLGTLENCDHWELRGSSGLINAAATAKMVAEATNLSSREEVDKGKERGKSWQWQDVYALVGKGKGAEREAQKTEDAKGVASLASWITRRLPIPYPTSSTTSTADPSLTAAPQAPCIGESSTSAPRIETYSPATGNQQARMLYGVPTSVSKPDKFNLERMALAVCRKLHNEGF